MQKPIESAKGLDPDPERNSLRALLKQADLKSHRQMLTTMAGDSEGDRVRPLDSIATCSIAGPRRRTERAIAILRAAVIRYPGDPWTNFELATLLIKAEPPQTDESIRFYTAARALKPESGFDLAEILERARTQRRGRDAHSRSGAS